MYDTRNDIAGALMAQQQMGLNPGGMGQPGQPPAPPATPPMQIPTGGTSLLGSSPSAGAPAMPQQPPAMPSTPWSTGAPTTPWGQGANSAFNMFGMRPIGVR